MKKATVGLKERGRGESKEKKEGFCDLRMLWQSESRSWGTGEQDCVAWAGRNSRGAEKPFVIYIRSGKVNHRAGEQGNKIA